MDAALPTMSTSDDVPQGSRQTALALQILRSTITRQGSQVPCSLCGLAQIAPAQPAAGFLPKFVLLLVGLTWDFGRSSPDYPVANHELLNL